MIKRTLYFGHPAYLSLSNSQLVVKLPEVETAPVSEALKKESTTTVPVEDVGIVILDNQRITITQGLVAALMENNVALVSCADNHLPQGLMLPLNKNTTQCERFGYQAEASLPLKKQLWQQTMQCKIHNQAVVLRKYRNIDTAIMETMARSVKSGDSDNYEAQAAVFYWSHLFPEHKNFVRGREEDPPNNLLNYGYALLRAIVARSLVGSGLMPTLGIHHRNKYNAYCLADDIMEPYRPYIDEWVIAYTDKHNPLEYATLTQDAKIHLLHIPQLDVTIEGKTRPLMVAVAQTTASLAQCYAKQLRRIAYPTM